MDPPRGTPLYDRLESVTLAVLAYEDARFPLEELEVVGTPQSAVDFMLDQRDMSRADLETIMGNSSHVSEFFLGKPLSVEQANALSVALHIPVDLLSH